MPLISRMYVWSIVLEPLLFFVLFEQTTSGVQSNLARILQMVVVSGLVLNVLARCLNSGFAHIRLPKLSSPLYINFAIYFVLVGLAGIIGFLSGAYDIPVAYEAYDRSGFSRFINSKAIRPLLEYAVTLYYFAYFVILPRYLLKTEKSLAYFFAVFRRMFIISFVVGVIDFGFAGVGISLVPRHIADWVMVGMRFHGLAGEPRDAFVYLFFGLGMLHLDANYKGVTLSRWWVVAIIAAALATQSASGLIGMVLFLGLYGIYSTGRLSIYEIGRLFILIPLVAAFLYVATINSERILMYLESASGLWAVLESREHIPILMQVQSVDIFPLYDMTIKLRNLDILPIIIGSGLGSASAVNNVYEYAYDSYFIGLNNPHAEIVRIIFESGLLGLYFFIISFTGPVKRLIKHLPVKQQRDFLLLMFLLLGCFFGHRSAAAFIYLGILFAVFRPLGYKLAQTNQNVFGRLQVSGASLAGK